MSNRLVNYLKDTRGEMTHVSWPTRRQVAIFTVVVVTISILTSFFLGFFDFLFTEALNRFFI